MSGTTLAWKTTWSWTGGTGVKSFTNVQLNTGINQKLSAITTIPVSSFWPTFCHPFHSELCSDVRLRGRGRSRRPAQL